MNNPASTSAAAPALVQSVPDRVEELAVALFLVSFDGRTLDLWFRANPIIREHHRRDARRLIEDGHLSGLFSDRERAVRERIALAIERSAPSASDVQLISAQRVGRLELLFRKISRGALLSAASIARSTP